MGRLIDTDVLKKHIKEVIKKQNGKNIDLVPVGELMVFIDREPTAYDPDKVVEQLEDYGNEETYYYKNTPYEKCIEECIGKAIQIVKSCEQEQKSECEWKLEDSESNLYVTECVNRHLIFEGTPEENGYKYCPYCGRKIKRGGVDGN